MVVKKSIVGQIENRNFLAPTGFQFQLNRAPKVAYFGNMVNIPSMTLGVANVPTYLKDLPLPGDKLDFEDFWDFRICTNILFTSLNVKKI